MSNGCNIRPIRDDDLVTLLAWRNHPNVKSFMLTQQHINMNEHAAWFAKATSDTSRRLLILEEEGEEFGYVQFSNVAVGGAANWGFYTRPNAPRGSGRKLGATALDYAFGALQLHKVCGQALASNEASIALHERLGFTREGVLREQQQIGDRYQSLICFGLLKHEWSTP